MKTMRHGIVVLAVMMWAGSAMGRWAQPSYVPTARLIENATAYIAEEPNDPTGYYALARIHYLAFINKAALVGTFNEREPSSVIPYWWSEDYRQEALRAEATATALKEFGVFATSELTSENLAAFHQRVAEIQVALEEKGWEPAQPTAEELIAHAGAAQWNFYQAMALDPNNALYTLGQASLGEQYLDFFAEVGAAVMPSALRAIVRGGVKETYLLAYNQSILEDLELGSLPVAGLAGIISYEAGSAFVRLWETEQTVPADVQEKITTIEANLATFEALPIGAVTPVVFRLKGQPALSELLAPSQVVSFDLDGDGRAEQRPWVLPTTGFLVWDANGDGRVTSGRELFGSVTWWMFFPNGYRALDVLDDSRNGWLEAGELDGISVWFDRNSNGVSDTGEVVSLRSLGIEAIATHATGQDGRSPMCTQGLRLRGGRTLPTYDWIAPPVEAAPGTLEQTPED